MSNFTQWRRKPKGPVAPRLDSVGGNVDRPALGPPDCPPHEREASVAALDELCRSRPLKPPHRQVMA